MRLVTAQCVHETNSFLPIPTTFEEFMLYDFTGGAVAPAQALGHGSEMAGFLAELEGSGVEVVPTVGGRARSGGNMTAAAVQSLKQYLLSALRRAGPADGVYLALHGATVGDGHLDVTGEILAEARALYGPQTPIVCSIDFHANATPAMARYCDALIGYRTFPHIDYDLVGRRAARLLVAAAGGEIHPSNVLVRLPMILPAEVTGDRMPPMSGLTAQLPILDQQPGIASSSIFCVQPWLDVEDLGCSIVVVADGDRTAAEKAAVDLARQYWQLRREFKVDLVPPAEAVRRALAQAGPVVLSDSADATTSGSSGDSTAILEELVRQRPERMCLLTVTDEEAVRQAQAAGLGATISVRIGGKHDRTRFKTLTLSVTVDRLSDGRYIGTDPMSRGHRMDMGQTAVLRCGQVYIVATAKVAENREPQLYRSLGLEPASAQVVVVKSPLGFRAAYESIAHDIMIVDAPGSVTPHLTTIPFTRLRRPLFPLDADMEWRPADASRPYSGLLSRRKRA